ncbi:MerR family transcriptional regulator [Streptomyces sp. NPDC051569]|uniref:MerR family transcriptional regulator n=1 Tax=Streptomyces sp. NPDC051569 TaxID=3365661 RepID=UPI00378CB523
MSAPGPAPGASRAPEPGREYRIEGLAYASGATVRTIRAYQNRGLLPRPERRGRANVYREGHLARLRQIAGLLDRGYTLASVKELLDAWEAGRGLGAVLGADSETHGPRAAEGAALIPRAEVAERLGGPPDVAALAGAAELGVRERVPGRDDIFPVPGPQELSLTAGLYAAEAPLPATSAHRPAVDSPAVDSPAVDSPAVTVTGRLSVTLPAETIRAVERLVGPENTVAFIVASTERELQARTLNSLSTTRRQGSHFPQKG